MENNTCEMEIFGPHQTILNEDLKMWYTFLPKLSTETERKVLSVVSHFLAYVEINENFITFVETWAMFKSSKLSSSQ
jgi:hypothetical protein